MKIVQLKISNFEKIVAFDVTPEDNIVTLSGPNGAGKSSVLHAIAALLNGGKDIPADPIIHEGAKKGSVFMDIGDYTAELSITPKSNTLKIVRKDGEPIKNTRDTLNGIIGARTLDDPIRLINESDKKKQRKMFMELMGIDTADLDSKHAVMYETRREVGREIKQIEGELAGRELHRDVPDKEQSISDLNAEWKAAHESNAKIQTLREQIDDKKSRYKALKNQIKEIEEECGQLKTEGQAMELEADNMKYINTEEMQKQIETAETTNQKVRDNQKRSEIQKTLTAKQSRYDELTERIQQIEQSKSQLLSDSKVTIHGLKIADDEVLYNNIPISKASSGEKIRLGFEFIAAAHPKFRVLRIEDGDKPDSKTMNVIKQIAQEKDIQVWIEKVDETGNVGIYIEEGEVRGIN